jgi:hypothetical protein
MFTSAFLLRSRLKNLPKRAAATPTLSGGKAGGKGQEKEDEAGYASLHDRPANAVWE